MKVGDLVISGHFGMGIIVEMEPDPERLNHSIRVLFSGTGTWRDFKHWCNPQTLEVLSESR